MPCVVKMPYLEFVHNLYQYLTGNECPNCNIIRKHTKKIHTLGDISFPLNIKNWGPIITNTGPSKECTIFDYLHTGSCLDQHFNHLIGQSKNWKLHVNKCAVIGQDCHLYIDKSAFDLGVKLVLSKGQRYGFTRKIFDHHVTISVDHNSGDDLTRQNLTELRLSLLKNVLSNLLNKLTIDKATSSGLVVKLTPQSNKKGSNFIVCGSVLNQQGSKDNKTTTAEIYQKRTIDLQLMSQHKYGLQVKSLPNRTEYFEKLGKSSVAVEMLENKPHKNIKILTNDLQTASKGPAFIFYNCARLSALLKEFERRVSQKMYPSLPPIEHIDFSLLCEPEEWTLFYVYILQFPLMLKDCIEDVEQGVVRPHYLILFLSNLASDFSIYYRRVKILTNARDHLLGVLFARMYFLRALQVVFHSVLDLIDIDPIQEM